MNPTTTEPQEEPLQRVTVFLPAAQKTAVRVVAAVLGTSQSDLMRDHTIDWIVAQYEALAPAGQAA